MIIPDPELAISRHFIWRDALYLPSWRRLACENDGLEQDTLDTLKWFFAEKMDAIRDYFDLPIIVHCAYRPTNYNTFIRASGTSTHQALEHNVAACDFHVSMMPCDEVRSRIIRDGLLDKLELRMEDIHPANWVHLDSRQPGPSGRFFKP